MSGPQLRAHARTRIPNWFARAAVAAVEKSPALDDHVLRYMWCAGLHGAERSHSNSFRARERRACRACAVPAECCRTGCPARVDTGTRVAVARMKAAVLDGVAPATAAALLARRSISQRA